MDLDHFCILINKIVSLQSNLRLWILVGHELNTVVLRLKMWILSGDKPKLSHLGYKGRKKRNYTIKKIKPMSSKLRSKK